MLLVLYGGIVGAIASCCQHLGMHVYCVMWPSWTSPLISTRLFIYFFSKKGTPAGN